MIEDLIRAGNLGANIFSGMGSDAGMQGMSAEAQRERERRMAPLLVNRSMSEMYLALGGALSAQRPRNTTPLHVRLASLDAGIAAFKAKRASER